MTTDHRVDILGIPVDDYTMKETVDIINEGIRKRQPLRHVVVNAAKIVNAQKDPELRNSIVNCDIINPDGQSVVWASRLFGHKIPDRVTGIDLMQSLVNLAFENNYRVYFLGAKPEVLNTLIEKYKAMGMSKIIAGYHHGYFNKDEESALADEISESGADILFVAMTSPHKEIFLDKYKERLSIPFTMGVGGSFDVFAGVVKRAPRWMQKNGLEWFFRVMEEPRRLWKRYLVTNTRFIYLIIKSLINRSLSK